MKRTGPEFLTAGCGRELFTSPVGLERFGPQSDYYERDARKIAFVRLAFPVGADYKVEELASVFAGLTFREPISLELVSSSQGITYQVACQSNQSQVIEDRIAASLSGIVVTDTPPRKEPVYSYLDTWRRLQPNKRPRLEFSDYYLPEPYVLPLQRRNLTATGGILEALSRVQRERQALALHR